MPAGPHVWCKSVKSCRIHEVLCFPWAEFSLVWLFLGVLPVIHHIIFASHFPSMEIQSAWSWLLTSNHPPWSMTVCGAVCAFPCRANIGTFLQQQLFPLPFRISVCARCSSRLELPVDRHAHALTHAACKSSYLGSLQIAADYLRSCLNAIAQRCFQTRSNPPMNESIFPFWEASWEQMLRL